MPGPQCDLDDSRRQAPAFLALPCLRAVVAVDDAPVEEVDGVGGAVGVLAVSLAAMGLYGAFSYMVTRRHAEMAIRIALGAGTAVVRGIVLWSVLKVLLIGCALGAVGIFLSATFIESQLHAVRAVDPWMLGLTLVAIAIVTAAATVGPIRCAARVDPGSYLRAL